MRAQSARPFTELPDAETSLKSSKIMIVDDEPINLKLAQKYLKLAGYQNFVTTNDSREAVGLVYMQQPDLILLDIMMPRQRTGHSGGATFRSALGRPANRNSDGIERSRDELPRRCSSWAPATS